MLTAVLQQRLHKDWRFIPAVVWHKVTDNPHPLGVGCVKQPLIVLPRAEVRIHLIEIQSVVPMIVCRLEDRRKHHGIEAKALDIVKLLNDSLQVSPTKHVLTLRRCLPPSVESIYEQMIDTDIIKPILHA